VKLGLRLEFNFSQGISKILIHPPLLDIVILSLSNYGHVPSLVRSLNNLLLKRHIH
jgi:hypothetical protein